eukprot:SAG11_NODE_1101_length_5868_cov_2.045935_6_plen_61_part_00
MTIIEFMQQLLLVTQNWNRSELKQVAYGYVPFALRFNSLTFRMYLETSESSALDDGSNQS